MDDSLEIPNVVLDQKSNREADDEQSSGDEHEGPDWTKLNLPGNSTRPVVIPKRGEKDFEPAPGGGSGLQQHVLNQARNAMFEALRGTRNSSSKSISYGIWYPDLARVHVTLARGIHFSVMGHSTPRRQSDSEDPGKLYKRLELLPEEAIYLVERGSLFCWKESGLVIGNNNEMEDVRGAPMSVQQAYTEMIGAESLTLEKYQVFAHLKRLGYVVTRSDPPSPAYPVPPPFVRPTQRVSMFHCLHSLISRWISKLLSLTNFSWWRPIRCINCFRHVNRYVPLFRSLRFISSPDEVTIPAPPPSSPYKIFFNIYKPSTPFRKTTPPPPDFSVVVVDTRTTTMPSYSELRALFHVLPEVPTPLPRQRHEASVKSVRDTMATPASVSPANRTFLERFFPWAFSLLLPSQNSTSRRQPNPFMALKAGKKTIVIAAVDVGNISFFRFSQGVFSEWPMI